VIEASIGWLISALSFVGLAAIVFLFLAGEVTLG
jgi:hypothetical protein